MEAPDSLCQFASDNYAGICPEAWEALTEANAGYAPSYGDDRWTARASDLLRELFETDCEVFFAFNGTAANSLALAAMCQSYHSIICHELSHIETDECGAPEFFSNGTKVLVVPGEQGRIDPAAVQRIASKRTDVHFPKPRVLSVTQPTEMGTVYSVAQLQALSEVAKRAGLSIHMDGSRFANAIATLQLPPKAVTWKVGVDVLCFGGTKNGMPVGEAIIFFNKRMAEEFAYRCKQAGQLASKMRFLAAPWVGMLADGAWLRNGEHANRCAARLEAHLREIPGLELLAERQANSVFVRFPDHVRDALRARGWRFYNFIGAGGARLMCSWRTKDADVDAIVQDIREASALPRQPEQR